MKFYTWLFAFATLVLVELPPASGQSDDKTYANTPEEMRPYNEFHDRYDLFFAEPQPFLGTGRGKAPPENLASVRIGVLAPLGDSREAVFGRRMLNGAILAIEEANTSGGYRGLPFELIVRDDVGPWGAASNKLVELNDEKVWAVLGSIDGQSTHIALRVALKAELMMVTTGSTDPTLTETRIPWLVRVNADDRQNSYALATHIFQEKGHRRVAVLRVNNRYGRVGIGEFRDAARRLSRPLLFELRFAPGDTSFTAQLERIKKSPADAIVLWTDAEEGGRIVKAMRAMDMQHPVYGSDRLVSDVFLETAGPAADGVIATYPFNPLREHADLRSFIERYRSRFREEPDWYSAHAFDGMNMIIDGIRKAGLNRVRIRDVLSEHTSYHGVTGEIPLDPTLNDVGPVWLVEVSDGEFR
ncbi:MAG: ABC transporter substrate-binding protein, partial [Rhodothermales bacterium]|nr:ABC transporter substrate-binding protein [Rhodothermales bacterium]